MRLPKLAYGAAALGSAALLCLTQQSASAATPVAWSAQYGGASASGTRWTEGDSMHPSLKIQGEVKNADSGCYSVWVTWNFDMTPWGVKKVASLCGPGTKAFTDSERILSPGDSGRLAICRGDERKECGTPVHVMG
ncbi:hypothetical protein [Streptomyces cinnamoneus]|uniref:Secreted protein n=1 Tax=Streptomyces cinnamoneus TaxID=53446 RepID=A0A918WR60_STRCJ|nr:hypothetical protein [Streptomyces cinnamoneus]GHC70088.1 hypothetical protein GCM10010507_56030 [Streptomyces cinnamoneus]